MLRACSFDPLAENCIFYISSMYEFLHSQGQSRQFWLIPVTSALLPLATNVEGACKRGCPN